MTLCLTKATVSKTVSYQVPLVSERITWKNQNTITIFWKADNQKGFSNIGTNFYREEELIKYGFES